MDAQQFDWRPELFSTVTLFVVDLVGSGSGHPALHCTKPPDAPLSGQVTLLLSSNSLTTSSDGNEFIQIVNFGAIAPASLCFVQHLICLAEEGPEILGLLALKTCHSKAGGHFDVFAFEWKLQRREFLTEAVYRKFYAFSIHVGQHPEKFVASQPPAHIRGSHRGLHQVCERFQHRISGFMSIAVINRFEPVNIASCNPKMKSVSHRTVQLFYSPFL